MTYLFYRRRNLKFISQKLSLKVLNCGITSFKSSVMWVHTQNFMSLAIMGAVTKVD